MFKKNKGKTQLRKPFNFLGGYALSTETCIVSTQDERCIIMRTTDNQLS